MVTDDGKTNNGIVDDDLADSDDLGLAENEEPVSSEKDYLDLVPPVV